VARYKPQDFQLIIDEALGQNDRAAITVGSSLVEYAIEEYIRSRLRTTNAEERKRVFSPGGLFDGFSKKIAGAYFLNLIGPVTRANLDIIRAVRNQVAHDMNPVSFDSTLAIHDQCMAIDETHFGVSDPYYSASVKFKVAVQFYAFNILLRVQTPPWGSSNAPDLSL
jgi:hypothetical protein